MRTERTRPRRSQRAPAMRKPSPVACDPSSFCGGLAKHIGEKCPRIDAMRGVVRARVDAARFFQVRAKIARSSFLSDGRFLSAAPLEIVNHHFERMQIYIAVGTILRAQAAADAPIFDNDFQRIAPSNRTDGAADHAERVAALAAPRGHEILVEAQA